MGTAGWVTLVAMNSESSTSVDASRPAFGYQAALDTVRDWAERLAVAAESAPLDTPVPSCPGWDLGKLVRHTGRVHRYVAALVAQRAPEVPARDLVDFGCPADDGEPSAWIAWYRSGAEQLLAVFDDTTPDTPMWSWGDDQHATFWARRMAHETVIHAVDAHLAVGTETAIDPTVAVDGLDELLEIRRTSPTFTQLEEPFAGAGTVHLHATDDSLAPGHGEWMITFGPHGYDSSHGHGKGDVAVKASAATLELLTLGRASAETAEHHGAQIFGDRDVLDRWLAGMTFT